MLALIPYVVLYAITHADTRLYWEQHSLTGLLRTIFRLRYGVVNTGAGFQSVTSKLHNVLIYLQHLSLAYPLVIALVIPGLLHMIRYSKKTLRFFAYQFFFFGPLLLFYTDGDLSLDNARGIIERYYLFSYPFIPFFIGAGYQSTKNYIEQTRLIKSSLARIVLLVGFVVTVGILTPLLLSVRSVTALASTLSRPVFEDHAQNILGLAPPKSILLLTGDVDLFPVQYMHYVRHIRPDITLVSYGAAASGGTPIEKILLKTLKEGRPVVTNAQSPPGGFSYRQKGPLVQLLPKVDKGELRVDTIPLKSIDKLKLPLEEERVLSGTFPFYFYRVIRNRYARALFDVAEGYFKQKNYIATVNVLDAVYVMNPIDDDTVSLYALSLIRSNQCNRAEAVLLKYFSATRSEKAAFALSRLYATCKKDDRKFSYWNEIYVKTTQKKQK